MKKTSLVLIASLLGSAAWAGSGTSLMQTAPVVPVGQFELKFQSDIVFNHGGGFNLSPHLVTGIIEHYFDLDTFVGAGTTDFQVGTLGKFNFLPDVAGQVGLSFLGGFSYLRDEGFNFWMMTLGVLVSKTFETDFGSIVPYSAFEFETRFSSGNNVVPLTLLLGSKWNVANMKPWSFYSELSFSLHDSMYALSVGSSYPF